MTDTPCSSQATRPDADAGHADGMIDWLQEEFPEWQVDVDMTSTWEGELQPLWIARRDGHHPQAELSPAKLHTRLTEYLEREARRRALMN